MKKYILYDERAKYSIEDALVLDTADTLGEARSVRRKLFPDAVIFEYDLRDGELVNGRRAPNYRKTAPSSGGDK